MDTFCFLFLAQNSWIATTKTTMHKIPPITPTAISDLIDLTGGSVVDVFICGFVVGMSGINRSGVEVVGDIVFLEDVGSFRREED